MRGIVLALSMGSSLACGVLITNGNGQLRTDVRQLAGFTAVEDGCALPVTVTQGPFAVAVTVDSNLLSVVTTQVQGDRLVIDTTGDISTSPGAEVTVALPTLTGLAVDGSGSVTAGPFDAGAVSVSVAGSGGISLQASTGPMTVTNAGSGSTVLSGSCRSLSIDVSGSGSVNAQALQAETVDVTLEASGSAEVAASGDVDFKIEGSGSIHASLDGGDATFVIDGSGSIDWSGRTTIVSQELTGSGSVNQE